MILMLKCVDIEKSGKGGNLMNDAISLYAQIVTGAIPYAVTFAIGDLIVSSFIRMAFGGKVTFGFN